ncbi:DUF853 domain-containing protein [Oligoflexia bacterium]|nr:DUF853 domain-containing protein [Oligoflexia bacterium]
MSKLLVGANNAKDKVHLLGHMANRHGLIAGATGTGKTVTLQVLAEQFSRAGVSVFTADVKGDLSGISQAGGVNEKIEERLGKIGIEDFEPQGRPVLFWDLYGKTGHPIRTTISEMGPLLLSRLLDLNEAQEGLLYLAFKFADEEGLLLLDLKDLQELLKWLAEDRQELEVEYGNINTRSIGAIQRRLLTLEETGGDKFFGEPALKLEHIMQRDFSGQGVISVLDARELMQEPKLYSTFLLWLLSELFEQLEEVGDQDLPKLVFFFDEAHLLFDTAPKSLLSKIEQVVRLIRSKGVGVYFVTQNPLDVPEEILGQLGHRFQHALRAFTPKDKKAVRVAANTFRQNPALDSEKVITELGIGEALVSVLDDQGSPTIVEQTLVAPPGSRIGPATEAECQEVIGRSPLKGVYDETVDRESAFEILSKRRKELAEEREEEQEKKASKKSSRRQSAGEAFFKSMLRSVASTLGRSIIRGILGSIKK